MYELYFGIAGPPFQLSPDPSFYFDTPHHHAALNALGLLFSDSLPICVLIGPSGTGKSTVLRKSLAEHQAAGVRVAYLASTQLDADDLIASVAGAFDLPWPVPSMGDDECACAWLRQLTGQRALLIVDEAQNLGPDALVRLGTLCDAATAEKVVLRVCLAGQPSLTAHFADPAVQGLLARIQQTCHLTALDAAQSRQYVEHRLHVVCWSGRPSFEAAAFEEIHRHSGGVPRRINLLCNRLMLAQSLARTAQIDAGAVTTTAHALDAEVGGLLTSTAPRGFAMNPSPDAPLPRAALLVIASGRSGQVKAVPLIKALTTRHDLPPARFVSVGASDTSRLNKGLHEFAGITQEVALALEMTPLGDGLVAQIEFLLEQTRPRALILFDGDAVAEACAMAGRKLEVPVVHVGVGAQAADEVGNLQSFRASIRRNADLCFDCQPPSAYDVSSLTAPCIRVGNLLIDALSIAMQMPQLDEWRCKLRPVRTGGDIRQRGYGVIALKPGVKKDADLPCGSDLITLLREVSRDLPLVWPMRKDTQSGSNRTRLAHNLAGDAIDCIDELSYPDFVALMRDATCVLTDCVDVIEEAAALGVPCVSLGVQHVGCLPAGAWLAGIDVGCNISKATRAVWEILFNGAQRRLLPKLWDGHAATRIAARLAGWLAEQSEPRLGAAHARQPTPMDEGWPARSVGVNFGVESWAMSPTHSRLAVAPGRDNQ